MAAAACKTNNLSSTTNNNDNSVSETIGPMGGEIDGPDGIKVT